MAALAGLATSAMTSATSSTAGSRTISSRRRPRVTGFMEMLLLGWYESVGTCLVGWFALGGWSARSCRGQRPPQVDQAGAEECEGLRRLRRDPEVHRAGGQRRSEPGRQGREPVDADRDPVALDGDLDLVVVARGQLPDRQHLDPRADVLADSDDGLAQYHLGAASAAGGEPHAHADEGRGGTVHADDVGAEAVVGPLDRVDRGGAAAVAGRRQQQSGRATRGPVDRAAGVATGPVER